MKIINQIKTYLKDSVTELKKVAWPTKKETINYTLLVIGISLALAFFIGIVDFILSSGLQKII